MELLGHGIGGLEGIEVDEQWPYDQSRGEAVVDNVSSTRRYMLRNKASIIDLRLQPVEMIDAS